ncbi:unnamed protein product [Porites lobata]|uniref:Uncharacterized protein n=1 Tax=Porites lobata TaxID=104759 RepID=A0ABN8S722_9CNID|nr:unnamed protein product [Porites lobata]
MLRVPLATSEKKTIFGRCVSKPPADCIKGLGQVDGFGVLEVVTEVSHQEQVLSQPGAAYFFSGFPPVLGDRQESLEPGDEVYLGLLTGRFVEKLAKDFSPTLNDIRLRCKQGSSRIWDRMKLKEGPYIQSSSPRRTS